VPKPYPIRSSPPRAPAPVTPPKGLLRTFAQALDYVIHRDIEKVRETPPPLSEWDLSPEVLKAIRYLWRALETGDTRTFELRDIYGVERLCAIPRSRWRVDPAVLVVEAFEATHGSFASLIARIESCTTGVVISADDLVKVFSAPVTANVPEPVASKPLGPLERKVKETLLRLFPEGIGVRDTYDVLLGRLADKKVQASRATLVRVLPHMPAGWREKR
jgi:hypothetical protein